MVSPKALARIAGALYLVVAIAGGFSQLVVRQAALVPGDPAATAEKIRASAALFRIGFGADAVNIIAFIVLAFVLYALLAPVNARIAATFVIFNAIAVVVMGVSLIGHAGALAVATDPVYAASLGAGSADALALLLLTMHAAGYLIAELFFGLWLLPLGYLVYRSGFFPRALGYLLMIGCFSYLASFAFSVSAPGFASSVSALVALPAALAEMSLLVWLLVKGVPVEALGARQAAAMPATI